MVEIHKIEIKNNSRTAKKKFYESAKEFNKWYRSHSRRYGTDNVRGYRLVNNMWEIINELL